MLDRKLTTSLVDVRTREDSLETSQGLRAPGWFKSHPLAAAAMILLSVLWFAALVHNLLTRGPLVELDQSLYEKLIAQAKAAPPRVNEIMIFGFFLGKQVVQVIVTILSVYFIYQHFWRELAMILISSAGGSFVWEFFVNYFARPRPTVQTGLAVTTIPAFPSGHAMSLVICYGFLAYLLIPQMPSLFWKWTLILAFVFVILFGGYSRIFQGAHYLTDVLTGYALGLAWSVLVYAAIEIIFMRRKI